MNPLIQITNLAKLDSVLNAGNLSNPKHFNASLPVLLKVLAQSKNGEYLLQLGRSQISTKSAIKLEIGKTYWANMQKNAANQIVLNNLIKNPKIMENLKNSPLKFSLHDLAQFWVMSEKIATLLKKHKDDLVLDCDFRVYVDSAIKPLFELENSLLDIKT